MYQLRPEFKLTAYHREVIFARDRTKPLYNILVSRLGDGIAKHRTPQDQPLFYLMSRSGKQSLQNNKEVLAKWIAEQPNEIPDADLCELLISALDMPTPYRLLLKMMFVKVTVNECCHA